MTKKEFIERIEEEIIEVNVRSRKQPKLLNNDFSRFIIVGEIVLAEDLEIVDEDTASKLKWLAKGRFKDEILAYYDAATPDEKLSLKTWLDIDHGDYQMGKLKLEADED